MFKNIEQTRNSLETTINLADQENLQRIREERIVEILSRFETISGPNIKDILKQVVPEPIHSTPVGGLTKDPAENVMRMLEGEGIMKGRMKNHAGVRAEIVESIEKYVNKNEPIKLVFIACPFKNPNIMSTVRTHPDLGEIEMVHQLLRIDETVKLVYTPGLQFEVLSETEDYIKRSVFRVGMGRAIAYKQGLLNITQKMLLGNKVIFNDLFFLTNQVPGFDQLMRNKIDKAQNQNHDIGLARLSEGIMEKSIDPLVTDPTLSVDELVSIDLSISNKDKLLFVQDKIRQEANNLTTRYDAYHSTRSELGLTKKHIIDNGGVYVVVREHLGRFAFNLSYPVTQYFPHHGHPVVDEKTGRLEIVRMADLLVDPERYIAVNCEDDFENKPFYFIKKN